MSIEKPIPNKELPDFETIREAEKKIEGIKEAMKSAQQLGDDDIRKRTIEELQDKEAEIRKDLEQKKEKLEKALQAWQREKQLLEEALREAHRVGLEVDLSDKASEIQNEISQIEKKLEEIKDILEKKPEEVKSPLS